MSSAKLEEELKERLNAKKLEKLVASLSGACISSGHCYSVDGNQNIFVKTNATLNANVMFDGEFESLKQINATKTIKAPKPFTVIHNFDDKQTSAIVMEFLNISSLSADCAKLLGRSLANLHDYNNKVIKFNKRASKWIGGKPPSAKQIMKTKVNHDDSAEGSDESEEENQFSKHIMKIKNNLSEDRKEPDSSEGVIYPDKFVPEPDTKAIEEFGFDVPTSCGSIPQINEWTQDWVSFYARHRLDKAIRSLLSVHSDRELNEQWSHLQLKVGKYFSDFEHRAGDEIIPALLHGDLWSGNAAQFSDGSNGVVYDPSSFYGHSEYDFGIVRMFGGFPREFERAYFEVMPKRKFFEKRNKLYQLFHHLNHWDHFGSGYRPSSLRLMKELNATA